jgi:hypothetical protein
MKTKTRAGSPLGKVRKVKMRGEAYRINSYRINSKDK